MIMNIRKNIGIILMMLGVLLTINQSGKENAFLKQLINLLKMYWPMILSFMGIYFISVPSKRK